MPVISKIRFTNVIYENGNKRYQDEIFYFDGHNSTIILENGGGKTVWVQAALQAILPHTEVADRKAHETFLLSEGCAHIGIEWILQDRPRRYLVTAVTLYEQSQRLQSYRYVYEYGSEDRNSLENIPYIVKLDNGGKRPTDRIEIGEYYSKMTREYMNAQLFSTIEQYYKYLSKYHIIDTEWKKIAHINGAEGGVGKFFEDCKTTSALVERLLIPAVEDAISGGGTQNFVEAFEQQREHIKRFKQLKNQIQECKSILENIQAFTGSFEEWDKEKKAFDLLRGKTKAVFRFIEEEYHTRLEEQKDGVNKQEQLISEKNYLDYKFQSYELLELENDVNKKYEKYKEVLADYEKIKDENNQAQHDLASLQYSRIKQSVEDYHKQEEDIQKSIRRLSQDDRTIQVEEKIKENGQYLLGYYKNAIEELERRIDQYQNEELRRKEELKEKEEGKKDQEDQKSLLEREKIENETKIDYLQKDMERLKNQIVDMPQHETVEGKELQIKKRAVNIEEERREIFDKLKKLVEEQKIMTLDEEKLMKDRERIKEKLLKEEHNQKNLDHRHNNLLQKIYRVNGEWRYIDSIYTNYEMLLSRIENQIEGSYIELNKTMEQERISLRWLDEYKESEYFTADPKLLQWIQEWKKEFTLLLTGVEYIQGSRTETFPYWPITLITTEKEVSKLKGYIEENREYISHPVWIMTDYEAGQYVNKGKYNEKEFVFPLLWERNIEQSTFKDWKEKLLGQAQVAQNNRNFAQEQYNIWNQFRKEVLEFLDEYPLETFQELRDSIYEGKKHKNQVEKSLQLIKDRKEQIAAEEKDLNKQKVDLAEELIYLTNNMESITLYKNKKQEIKGYKKTLDELIYPKLKGTQEGIGVLTKDIKDLKETLEDIKESLRNYKDERDRIIEDSLYREVQVYMPKYSSYSKEVLVNEREDLKNELQKRQKGRRELEEQLLKVQKEGASKERELEQHTLRYPAVDKSIRFIEAFEEEINTLIEKIKGLTQLEETSRAKVDHHRTQYDQANGRYEPQKKEFEKNYPEVYKWMIPLDLAYEELVKEKEDLERKMNYIKEQLKRISMEIADVENAKNDLKIENGRFEYLREEVLLVELGEEEKQEIRYQRSKKVNEILNGLGEMKYLVESKKNKLQKEEQNFTQFCRENIIDIRLREMTLKGIERLNCYEQVIQWEDNLFNRIMRTQRVAEDDLKTHDEELQLFIEFIHSYVQQVAEGLREIPRKTRIKIEDQWKEVYSIQVPEWDKIRGKEEIQKYILWIITQLESGDHPEEIHSKQIEKWLSIKQLLGIVTQDRPVTVRCRKLTNQNTIATMASSWESSNKWSGGEKWSKNMILFLGLLNFLAEKTGHVIEGQRRNRAVILDNPFGQASSDHVLNPVFFVAEQLGFQIITLTALAEGSFIRKYFPVVYSCRLREATDGTQIMRKELQIQRALFKDEELPSISRLGVQEQLTLLGI